MLREAMQDLLKPGAGRQQKSVTFKSDCNSGHSKFLTPHNIDDLILKLNKIDCNQTQQLVTERRANIDKQHLPPDGTKDQTTSALFSDHFIQALPVPPLIGRGGGGAAGLQCMPPRNIHHATSWQEREGGGRGASRYIGARLAPLHMTDTAGSHPPHEPHPSSVPSPRQYSSTKWSSSIPAAYRSSLQYCPMINTSYRISRLKTPDKPVVTVTIPYDKPIKRSCSTPSTVTTETVTSLNERPIKLFSTLSGRGSRHSNDRYTEMEPELPGNQTDRRVFVTESFTSNEEEEGDERDSGWTDGDQWLGEEEILSDLDDDCSILSSTGTDEPDPAHPDHTHLSAWDVDPMSRGDSTVTVSRCSSGEGASFIPPRATAVGERGGAQATAPLTPSLFRGRPPTIHFPLAHEKYESLRSQQRSLLRWRMSTITPNVVKRVITRVGFKSTNGSRWIGYWGKHLKAEGFRAISHDQKVNHFPGSFNLGRKDRLWRNLFRMQAQYGKKEFFFTPETYVLPSDMRNFKRAWETTAGSLNGKCAKWIVKPPASARGIGIKVINKWSQVPKKRPVIVQRYIADPFLINGSKFDLRVYVYVSSFDPLVIYIYRDGLVRFATVKYSKSMKKLSNRYMHLTNYSVNKHSSQFISNSDETQCYGHKWGLLALWRYMESEMGMDPGPVWERIKDVVIKTIISCEGMINSLIKANVRHTSCVHELFGFDVMLDSQLKPWLLEVNVSPSLHSNSSLDLNIKEVMMRDIFNVSGFKLPSPSNERIPRAVLSTEDKIKHSKFTHSNTTQQVEPVKILEHLTEDDCNCLMDLEDEYSRRGGLIRVFPVHNSYDVYGKYFQIQRYYNILIDQWLTKYSRPPHQSINELRKLQDRQFHKQQ